MGERIKKMIPKNEYIFVDDVGNVITDELFLKHHNQNDYEIFSKWMRGQTCIVLPDGKVGIYSWDYERWLKQGKKKEQGADWD